MIELLQVKLSDVEQLRELAHQTFYTTFAKDNSPGNMKAYCDKAFSKEHVLSELKDESSKFYFAEFKGQVVGYLRIKRTKSLLGETELQLGRLYILEEFQGRKFGTQLLEATIEFAKVADMNCIWLGVWEHNLGAIRFYERHGFSIEGNVDFQMGDELQRDFIMKLYF